MASSVESFPQVISSDAYSVEPDFGHGDMAAVYAVRDTTHGRRVVLKVLHPELGFVRLPLSMRALAIVLTACTTGHSNTGGATPTGPQTSTVTSVSVTPSSVSLTPGEAATLTAAAKDANGSVVTDVTVVWATSDTTVARVSSLGLVTGVAPGQATLTARVQSVSGTAAATVILVSRSTVDRPDDVVGAQVHIVYALPSDGTDRGLDTNGVIANSVGSGETWLAGQTGGRQLRLDTYRGVLDVTFFQLSRTNATMEGYGAYVRDTIERELTTAGLVDATKIYAVFYDGSSTYACGGGAWPPALDGRVGALYLEAAVPGYLPCYDNAFAESPTSPPGYWEFAVIHELMHVQGFVAIGAPDFCTAADCAPGHVDDSNTDLLYAGSLPWYPSVLDYNHRNYYGSSVPANVLNFEVSPYLGPPTAAARERARLQAASPRRRPPAAGYPPLPHPMPDI